MVCVGDANPAHMTVLHDLVANQVELLKPRARSWAGAATKGARG